MAWRGHRIAKADRLRARRLTLIPLLPFQEGDYLKRPEVKIPIPDALKVQLVDDWEAVTKNHQVRTLPPSTSGARVSLSSRSHPFNRPLQLVSLPREPNVHTLIQEYKAYALAQIPSTSSRRGEQPCVVLHFHVEEGASLSSNVDVSPPHETCRKTAAIISEVLSGLQLYFDRSLGANLLYRFERAQYVDFRRRHQEAGGGAGSGEDFEASKIYGAEHLLRLFGAFTWSYGHLTLADCSYRRPVNLPSFIAHTNMDADSIIILREHIGEFMR